MSIELPKIGSVKYSRDEYQSDNAYVAAILNEHGITKQTGINEAAGEATYVDYAGAIQNQELIGAVLNGGFGETDGYDENELAMKENIANIYKSLGSSVIQTNDLVAMIRSMGYEVEWGHVTTQYMVDDKGNGADYRKQINTAGLSVLTITDKDGNDIVIADANGNAAIEIEEVFLDEILTGAVNAIENMDFESFDAGAVSQSSKNWMSEQSTFDVSFVMENKDSEDIWLLYNESKLEREEEKEQLRKEQEEKVKKAKEENKVKDVEAEKAEAKALLEAQVEAEKAYNEEMTKFKDNRIKEMKDDEKYADYSDEELEELVLKEAAEYCKKKLGYTIEN